MFRFPQIEAVREDLIAESKLQHSMLFEISMARAERLLEGDREENWDKCIEVAEMRQKEHFDARAPEEITSIDIRIAEHAARNLVVMLDSISAQNPKFDLESHPIVPGLGWIASGAGDFSLGPILVEVKNTDRNFISGDFRQVLMYWILRYSSSIELNLDVWSDCLLLNPRRNAGLRVNFNYLLKSASAGLGLLEIVELMRSIVGHDGEVKW